MQHQRAVTLPKHTASNPCAEKHIIVKFPLPYKNQACHCDTVVLLNFDLEM